MQRDNSANWAASWTAAQSQPATKSVKHRKRCCFCHVLKKDPARLLKNVTKHYANLPNLPHEGYWQETRTLFKADDRQSTRERTLSGPWPPVVSWRFTLEPVSLMPHYLSFFFPCAIWLCHRRLWDHIHQSVRMLPVRLALCDLEAPGWGEPWFPHCAFVAPWLTDFCMALLWSFCFVVCFTVAIPIPWWYNVIIFLVQCKCLWTDQLITDRAVLWFLFWVVLFVWFLVWFALFLFSLFAFLYCTVTAQWIMYRSNSVLFCLHIVDRTDVATDLIRWICKMQLSFRLDKRPGESHLALDGKKKGAISKMFCY